MSLTFPRDLVLEMYLGRWVDVATLPESRRLRQVEPVTVSWGSSSEQSKALAPPSTAEGVLHNTGGHWTPGNPMSDYYDYLQGRNVPTRLGLRVSRDAFGRTVASGWDFSDTGDGWNVSTSGTGSTAVGSGVGTHTQPNANAYVITFLGDSYGDCEARCSCNVQIANITGGSIEPLNLVQRYQPSGAFAGEHYLLRVEMTTAEAINLSIHHSTLGNISGGTISTGLVQASDRWFRAAFYAEGQTLRGKIWDAANPEPLGWQISAHHDRLSGGFPGIRTGIAAGNTNLPVTARYDDWELILRRHSGELTKLQPSWDVSHKVKTAAVKMADVTQRLGRSQRASLSSAPRRYLTTSHSEMTASDFWALDEAPTAPARGVSALGKAPATFQQETGVSPNRGAVTWGATDAVHTAVPGFVGLNNGGRLIFPVDSSGLGSAFSAMWSMRLSPDAGAQIFLSTTTVTNRHVFFLYTDGTYELFSNPSAGVVSSGTITGDVGWADQWVTLGVCAFPTGAEMDIRVFINGVNVGGGFVAADAGYAGLREILVHVPQPTTGGQGDSYFSTLFVTPQRFDTFLGSEFLGEKVSNIIMGWPGEKSGLRAFRLTAEEGVPFDYWGDLGQTRAMGPQRPLPLLDQLVECAEVDGALLYAPRYTTGVAFRGRRAMAARAADCTLSYSANMVAPTFAPSADDRPTANLVKAERTNGGHVFVEQATGPMNTDDPGTGPDAAGTSPAQTTVNAQSDAQLGDVGGWVRALGTVPEVRFPRVSVNLRAPALNDVAGLTAQRALLALRPGDRLLVTGMQAADVYRDLDQLVRGGKETYRDAFGHKVELNAGPYEKYRAAVYGDSASRYDGAVTTLDAQLTAGTTGARNVTTTSGPVWTTAAGAFPLAVVIGGERCTVSGITGTGAAQVMTISARAQNGVSKTHPAGTRVYLADPVYYC
ncbi:MAG TPA: hypothetical protein VGX25_35400 [Actinophytocola sp.]|uniref:hypothetical protein n=1 Tax=Actinophytocola sp. TaxID=1872138 RepID=UPI002DDD80E7|nr:hypothetical protein [Actinophytocola sp.]HEV2784701.1 hypothetical protein [Actinophytocola sp.]